MKHKFDIEQEEFEQHWHESNVWEQRDEVVVGCFIGMVICVVLAVIFN